MDYTDILIWNNGTSKEMKENITIVKVGGAVVEDEAQLVQLLRDFTAIEGAKILVHGGGRRATKIAERLGIETKMVDGRRITDADLVATLSDSLALMPISCFQ